MESTTQNQTTQLYTITAESTEFMQNVKTYLLNPLSTGLVGFTAFFSLILFTKLFSYFLGINEDFSLGLNDVIYSFTGFIFAAGAKFLEFFGKED